MNNVHSDRHLNQTAKTFNGQVKSAEIHVISWSMQVPKELLSTFIHVCIRSRDWSMALPMGDHCIPDLSTIGRCSGSSIAYRDSSPDTPSKMTPLANL
jgi:hypothetical protein